MTQDSHKKVDPAAETPSATSPETPRPQQLPFATTPTASVAGPTLAQSTHQWRKKTSPLRSDAPNVVIIMLDDVGFAHADTVGGAIHTPTLSRIADTGLRYNAFHTTAICSATRASLLTGRNHHRVESGTITEFASDFDGYTGEIPKSAATIPEVLKHYGYSTAAFGKWHNTPALQTSAAGPFDRWPTGCGFDHFYGFIAAETSQYQPSLYRNTTPIEAPNDPTYHLSEDLAAQATSWLREQHALTPDKPFFMYWAPGAVHGPHQVFSDWSDKYKGKFDAGWDAYREEAFKRQVAMGWIPADSQLTPRPDTLAAWESLPLEERKYQARLMEVFAGFLEHADVQAGKVIDELERLGLRDNTLIFYVLSDNGASAEGAGGTINEILSISGVPIPFAQQMKVLEEEYGGLQALGGPKVANMYHAGWAWAGESPFQGTKLVAGYFGGTRVPMMVSWPKGIASDMTVRGQFHHVNDIAPTIYELIGIAPPSTVNGIEQDPIDGTSLAYSFSDASAPTQKSQQYFEIFGSRGIFADGWMASVFGPRLPWLSATAAAYSNWNPDEDAWSLYHLESDYSQSTDLAQQHPEKLAELKGKFDEEARANHVYPIGAGLGPLLNPSARIGTAQTEWHLNASVTRLPEFCAPNLRGRSNKVTVDVKVPALAEGVLYSLGGVAGGLTLYMDDGYLHYEYNSLSVMRTRLRSANRIEPGSHRLELQTLLAAPTPGASATFVMRVDGIEVARATAMFTAPLCFTASETLDVGISLGSPVSLDYYDRAPFRFNGQIDDVHIVYTP
ncbi:arylsulfatase [Variovorax sp. J22R133]|uniref:arylsulfatase n=1 Tax=Variovorax brevis TaxID=3053503 RepID=UPI00257769EF|nr:arylsulfatase [Variovorax sp. J22R133]MDM0113690.1 arylsulfatase [Variovorax sp. J22R133]